MSARRDGAAAVGVGVAACAACCAGPLLGALLAAGIGTIMATVLFGGVGVFLAGLIGFAVLRGRRRARAAKRAACAVGTPTSVPVTIGRSRPS